jgi:hypothetical protein
MPFTARLLIMPPWLLFVLINTLFVGLSILLLYLVRRWARYQVRKGHNDAVSSIFNKAGTVFGIMLAFVVVILWQEYNKSGDRAVKEGTEAFELYQDLRLYPNQKQAAGAANSLVHFAKLVITDEYPAMARMQLSPATERAMIQVRGELQHIKPETLQEQILYTKLLRDLESLSKMRQERLADMESSLPGIFWGALIVGVIITIFFSILLGAEKFWLHSLLTSMLAVILGTTFFLIIELDYPFMGKLSAKPVSYIAMLQAVDANAPGAKAP